MGIALTLGAAWGALVGAWIWFTVASSVVSARRPIPTVARASGTSQAPTWPAGARLLGVTRSILAALGRPVRRRVLGDAHTAEDPWIGLGLLASMASALVLHPLVGLVPAGTALALPPLRARRAARHKASVVVDQLPDVVDLLRLTTLAGLPVSAAVAVIGPRPGGAIGEGLRHAAQQLSRGATTSTALDGLASRCGLAIRPLIDVLVDHDRYGTPLGPALDRVSIESRLKRRRHAEEAARRLPVALLFPLVLTTLPACVLLTVVPLLVASLSSLQP